MSIYTEECPFLHEGWFCSNIPHHLFPWWYILDIYIPHTQWQGRISRAREGRLLGQKKRGNVIAAKWSLSHRGLSNHSLLHLTLSPLCNFPNLVLHLQVMHAFTLNRQINYAKSCKSLFSLIFLPLVTALKATLLWIVLFFTWPLLLQESCPGPEKYASRLW